MSDTYQVVLELVGSNRAAPALQSVRQNLQGISADTRNANVQLDGMNRTLNSLRNLAGAAFAGVSLGMVKDFAEQLYATGREVNRAEALFTSFTGVIGNNAQMMDRLRTVTRGAVSDLDLMNGANGLLSMRIATSADSLEHLTNIAATFAQAMGTDVGGSLEQLSMIIANQSYLRLDSLGISSAAVKELADQYKAAGMSAQDAFTQAFLDVADGMMPQMSAVADQAINALDRLQTWGENVGQQAGQNFAVGFMAIVEGIPGIIQGANLQLQARALTSAYLQSQYSNWILPTGDMQAEGSQFAWDLINNYPDFANQILDQNGHPREDIVQAFSAYQGRERRRVLGESMYDFTGMSTYDPYHGVNLQAARVAQLQRQFEAAQAQNLLQQSYADLGAMFGSAGGSVRIGVGGTVNNMPSFFNPAMLGNVFAEVQGINEQLVQVQALGEQGLITDDAVSRFEELAQNAREIAAGMEAAADATHNMSLDYALFAGNDPNELLGDIQSRFLSGVNYNDAWMNRFALSNGSETELSQQIDALIARYQTTYANAPQAGMTATQNLEAYLRAGREQGLGDDQLLAGLRMFSTYGGGEATYTNADGETMLIPGAGAVRAFEAAGLDPATLLDTATGVDSITASVDAATAAATEFDDTLTAISQKVYDVPIRLVIQNSEILSAMGLNIGGGAGGSTGAQVNNNNGHTPGAASKPGRSTPPNAGRPGRDQM